MNGNLHEQKKDGFCASPETLVSYLYGEMGEEARDQMETHLANCEPCTAEFAEISFARLDVYEWQRDEFAQMSTPPISIPYHQEPTRGSWLDVIRIFFASAGRWTVPAAGLAAVTIALGVWMMSSVPVEVAVSDKVTNAPPREIEPASSGSPVPTKAAAAATDTVSDTDSVKPLHVVQRPATVQARPAITRVVPAVTAERRPEKPAAARPAAPRLNDFEEEDDNTLRLGDLLAEIDTRE